MNGLRKKENLYFFISSILFLVVYYKFDISLGFNPTDEGRNFAYIEKILNGKVPHKDFLHIHFIGSTILHLYGSFGSIPTETTYRSPCSP